MRFIDWSSDVCSSDLVVQRVAQHHARAGAPPLLDQARHVAERWLRSLKRTGAVPVAARLGVVAQHADGAAEVVERRVRARADGVRRPRSDAHPTELQSLMRTAYSGFCL